MVSDMARDLSVARSDDMNIYLSLLEEG